MPEPNRRESPTGTPLPIIVEPGVVTRTLWLIRRAFIAAYEDNCYGIAKGAAYSALLSLFPVLTTLAVVLVQLQAESVAHLITRFLIQVVPPGTEDLIISRFREQGTKPIALPISAIAISWWAGSGAMLSLMEGFQAAYRIPAGRPFLKQRGMAMFLVLATALPAVGASTLILFGNRTEPWLLHSFGMITGDQALRTPILVLGHVARYLVGFATTIFVTGLLYYFGPNYRPETGISGKRHRFFRVWEGALVATVFWLIATAGFGLYVGRVAHYNVFYGSIGTVIALLVWMYLLSVIALIGCEYNAERDRMDSILSLY